MLHIWYIAYCIPMTQGGSTSLGWEVCCYKNTRHLMIISKDMHMQLSLAPSILTPFSCQCAAGATALSSMGGRKTQSTRHTHTHTQTHLCSLPAVLQCDFFSFFNMCFDGSSHVGFADVGSCINFRHLTRLISDRSLKQLYLLPAAGGVAHTDIIL